MNLLNIAIGVQVDIEYEEPGNEVGTERHHITLTDSQSIYDDYNISETISVTSDLLEDLELNLTNLVVAISNYRKEHFKESF